MWGQPPSAVQPAKPAVLRQFYPGDQPTQCRDRFWSRLFFFHLTLISRRSDAQKYESGAIQPHHVFVGQAANPRADSRLRNGRDLIHHQPANSPQPIAFAGLDHKAKQRSISRVGGERADGDRICPVETVVLQNNNWTRLSRVVLAACDSPNFATLHALPQSATASIKAWSSPA